MRKPFRKNLDSIPVEDAHGGSGSRKLILSKDDPISEHFHAMTKGYLPPKGVFDWHHHDNVDEFFLVLQGTGRVAFRDGTEMAYGPNDLIYVPAGTEHRIENSGTVENEFYFVRLDS